MAHFTLDWASLEGCLPSLVAREEEICCVRDVRLTLPDLTACGDVLVSTHRIFWFDGKQRCRALELRAVGAVELRNSKVFSSRRPLELVATDQRPLGNLEPKRAAVDKHAARVFLYLKLKMGSGVAGVLPPAKRARVFVRTVCSRRR